MGIALGATLLYSSELSPSLEVLPLNSTLSDVTIPRYDENQNRVAYLKADLMEILADGKPVEGRQPIMVDCTGIQLRMAYEAVDGDVSVDMKHARYRITPGVLTVQETITARSPRFHITGNGGVFHLDSRRGFIFGPLDCDIFSKQTAHHPTMLHPFHALLASTSLLVANSGHKPPSAEALLEVERLAKSSRSEIQASQQQIEQTTSENQAESKLADQRLMQFAEDVESKSLNLLIQNPPAPNAAVGGNPPLKDPEFTIHCDGGCFFDGNENLLVLLRNVVVKEARFTLKAQEEIKVFFNAAAEEDKKDNDKEGDKDQGAKLNITDVKNLVATGGVHFSGIDKEGNPVEATAATAFYNDQDKVLILKDGNPTFWTKKGKGEMHLRAADKNASVTIELAGKSMSAHTSAGAWNFGAKNLPLKKN
ncbi:MAG: hypothetical protein ACSHYB_08275 [Roseibacillus sp.]